MSFSSLWARTWDGREVLTRAPFQRPSPGDTGLILAVEVPGYSADRPYRTGKNWYIRDANRSREIGRSELLRLVASGDSYYDEQPVAGTSIGDIDIDAFRSFFAMAYSGMSFADDHARALLALKCLDRSGAATVAGILLFAKEPSRWLPDARVSVVRVKGVAFTTDFLDKTECEGRLLDQFDAAFRCLRGNSGSSSASRVRPPHDPADSDDRTPWEQEAGSPKDRETQSSDQAQFIGACGLKLDELCGQAGRPSRLNPRPQRCALPSGSVRDGCEWRRPGVPWARYRRVAVFPLGS
jgi:hypothetical protein